MGKLKDKKILITGGSKGIGKGISKVFLQNGAKVFICSRNQDDLESAKHELSELGEINIFKADITKPDEVKEFYNEVNKIWNNKLDVLVNNASILGVKANILDYPTDVWDDVINVNLNAQFYVTKQFLPMLLNTKNSSIINVSSSVGRKGRAEWGAYSASKFGLEGLTQILADELEGKVRVNSVNPGGTSTEMRAKAYPDEDPSTIPSPVDITPIFIYLASDESIHENGKEFNARDFIVSN